MKPEPPVQLLGPGQVWVAVPAPGWVEAGDKTRCSIRWWVDRIYTTCPNTAVIMYIDAAKNQQLDALCTEHMGYHRWVDNGTVMQWRADPVWISKRRPRMPPRKR